MPSSSRFSQSKLPEAAGTWRSSMSTALILVEPNSMPRVMFLRSIRSLSLFVMMRLKQGAPMGREFGRQSPVRCGKALSGPELFRRDGFARDAQLLQGHGYRPFPVREVEEGRAEAPSGLREAHTASSPVRRT